MPRTCTLCSHPQRTAIDKALTERQPYRGISRTYRVSEDALARHKAHLGTAIAKAEARREETLVQQIERYRLRLETSLTGAESAEDWRGVAALTREVRGFLELVARLTGQLRPETQVNVAIVQSSEWLTLQSGLVDALMPYPEAQGAVVGFLERSTGGTRS